MKFTNTHKLYHADRNIIKTVFTHARVKVFKNTNRFRNSRISIPKFPNFQPTISKISQQETQHCQKPNVKYENIEAHLLQWASSKSAHKKLNKALQKRVWTSTFLSNINKNPLKYRTFSVTIESLWLGLSRFNNFDNWDEERLSKTHLEQLWSQVQNIESLILVYNIQL
jgi:hypothetical protein